MGGRLYTRLGDDGTTFCLALGSGRPVRVPKSHPLIELLGTIDEANSMLGLARAYARVEGLDELDGDLRWMQRLLFNVGFSITTGEARVSDEDVRRLESLADKYYGEALRRFVLPSGGLTASSLHVARAMVRRAERRMVSAVEKGFKLDNILLKTMNRASDALFAMAVYAARKSGKLEEV